MIVDCFTFFNELDLLELRFETLEDTVDRFVLCEAPYTFRGEKKPLVFTENAARFERWRDRITVIVHDEKPDADPWTNEWAQRDALARGLISCEPGDTILLSDCDEIPDPHAIVAPAPGQLIVYRQIFSMYFANLRIERPWHGTRSFRAATQPRFGAISRLRNLASEYFTEVTGGWHFTHLGGIEAMRQKVRAYAHAEVDIPYYNDRRRVEEALATGYNHRDGSQLVWAARDASFPEPMRTSERYASFFCDPPSWGHGDATEDVQHAHGVFSAVPDDAPRVHAIASQRQALWQRIGRERYGNAFIGASLTEIEPGDWVVIDELERQIPTRLLPGIMQRGARIVAAFGNARGFETLHDVASGEPFPRGDALTRDDVTAMAQRSDYRIETIQSIVSARMFMPSAEMEPVMSRTIGAVSYLQLTKTDALDMMVRAFIFTMVPNS